MYSILPERVFFDTSSLKKFLNGLILPFGSLYTFVIIRFFVFVLMISIDNASVSSSLICTTKFKKPTKWREISLLS